MQKQVYEFISQQLNDPIIERRTCKVSGQDFPIYSSDAEFYKKASPKIAGKTYEIPFPTLCPQERQRRRLAARNERNLYRRKCDISGKDIISIYSPDKKNIVCDEQLWRKDEIDPIKYGKDFDFNHPFFEQYRELLMQTPIPSLHVVSNENSIINQCGYSKNCYLSFNTDFSEDCYYCVNTIYSKKCVDVLNGEHCEVCARSSDIKKSFKIINSRNIQNCNNIYYSEDLQGCSFCFGCKNLQNKQYYIYNKQYSKEEYEQQYSSFKLGSRKFYREMEAKLKDFFNGFPRKCMDKIQSENSFGHHITNAQNTKICFDTFDVEDVAYCGIMSYCKSTLDFNIGGYDCELCYEVASAGDHDYHCLFCNQIRGNSKDLYYCNIAKDCKNCFGCVGIRNKEYCIFNKQYTQAEYEEIVPKIIEHMQKTEEWGEFFPVENAQFGYNETIAQEYYPLGQNTANQRGYPRKVEENNISIPQNMQTIKANELSDNIHDTNDDVIGKAIICETSQKPFKIIKQELDFYKKYSLPLPTQHMDVRHQERLDMRDGRELYVRKCDKTGETILSVVD